MNVRLRRSFFSPAFSVYGQLSEMTLPFPRLFSFSSCSDSDYCSVVLSAGAPSAPGCLAASGRQARLRQAAAGAPASLRRTRWRGFGLSLRSDA
ncbi:hypothetical protein NLK29_002107 [Escherichia coli]|nr:hypothetical protein [Escherichia coli]